MEQIYKWLPVLLLLLWCSAPFAQQMPATPVGQSAAEDGNFLQFMIEAGPKLIRLLLFGVIAMISYVLLAQTMEITENDRLARISRDLQYIETMVAEAQKQADQSGRVRFDYDALMLDLKRVRLKIDEYME